MYIHVYYIYILILTDGENKRSVVVVVVVVFVTFVPRVPVGSIKFNWILTTTTTTTTRRSGPSFGRAFIVVVVLAAGGLYIGRGGFYTQLLSLRKHRRSDTATGTQHTQQQAHIHTHLSADVTECHRPPAATVTARIPTYTRLQPSPVNRGHATYLLRIVRSVQLKSISAFVFHETRWEVCASQERTWTPEIFLHACTRVCTYVLTRQNNLAEKTVVPMYFDSVDDFSNRTIIVNN